jgi:hypothetical protein
VSEKEIPKRIYVTSAAEALRNSASAEICDAADGYVPYISESLYISAAALRELVERLRGMDNGNGCHEQCADELEKLIDGEV